MITADIFDRTRNWLFQDCLPFWAKNGPDWQYGGFIEDLTMDGADAAREFKRTRVSCRQVYVFSHAKLLGWDGGNDLIAHGSDFLTEKAWMADQGAFARRLTRAGEVLDPTIDLYDHAFALFAFAWAFRATGEGKYREWVTRTYEAIEKHLRRSPEDGFLHQTPVTGWRQQNPHMHLLEASMAAYSATQEERYLKLACELRGLFSSTFFNGENGTLTEFFTDDWNPAPGEPGRIVEPGHHFEWAWLLHQCDQSLGGDSKDEITALVSFAEKFGVDRKSGATFNSTDVDGAIIDGGSRTWPNTERIKAGVTLVERGDMRGQELIGQSTNLLIDRYLSDSSQQKIPLGAWVDAFDQLGTPTAELIPASTLYHVFLAFAEMLRIESSGA